MVTRPLPFWERWMRTPQGRERLYTLAYLSMILLNVVIALGLVLFMLFWYYR